MQTYAFLEGISNILCVFINIYIILIGVLKSILYSFINKALVYIYSPYKLIDLLIDFPTLSQYFYKGASNNTSPGVFSCIFECFPVRNSKTYKCWIIQIHFINPFKI